jgi:hypothetical protein
MQAIYDSYVDNVWKALTYNAEMNKWYFVLSDFKPEVVFSFNFKEEQKLKPISHLCEIVEVVSRKKNIA